MFVVLLEFLIFFAVFFVVLAIYGIINNKRRRVAGRLKEIHRLSLVHEINEIAVSAKDETIKLVPSELDKKNIKSKFPMVERYFHWLSKKLEKAHLLYRPKEFFLLSLGMAFFVLLIMFFSYDNKLPGAMLAFLVLISGFFGFMIPNFYLTFRERRLKNQLSSQVGDMILLLSNYLRAGHSFTRSIELVSREVSSPLADELKTFIKDVNLGGTLSDALTELESRTQDEDLGLVLTAIQIHHQIGGNLSEILDSINHTIRERIRLKGEIKTLTAQGRLTAIVISLLPIVVALFISYLHPSFIRTLYMEPAGQLMLAFAVILELIGILLVRKIVQIEF